MSNVVTVPDTFQAATQLAHLTLIVPGLVPDSPEDGPAEDQAPLSCEGATETEQVLKRFDWQTAVGELADESWEGTLMRAVGAPVLPPERLPVARLRWSLDAGAELPVPQHVVCADPVHLQVDRDSVSVIPPQALSITREEADACASSINDLLRGDGLELVVGSAESWYLTGGDTDGLSAAPTHAVARRKIPTSLATDAASSQWRQLNSELQMLLHAHPVNESRASRGLLPINSVWFCGGEALSEVPGGNATHSVYSADVDVLALSQALGVSTSEPEALVSGFSADVIDAALPLAIGNSVWVDLSLYRAWLSGDPDAIALARSATIEKIIGPALEWLDSGALSSVRIEAGDGLQGLAVPATRIPSWLMTLTTRLLSRLGIGSPIDGASR